MLLVNLARCATQDAVGKKAFIGVSSHMVEFGLDLAL